jgi:hypothetical protein
MRSEFASADYAAIGCRECCFVVQQYQKGTGGAAVLLQYEHEFETDMSAKGVLEWVEMMHLFSRGARYLPVADGRADVRKLRPKLDFWMGGGPSPDLEIAAREEDQILVCWAWETALAPMGLRRYNGAENSGKDGCHEEENNAAAVCHGAGEGGSRRAD